MSCHPRMYPEVRLKFDADRATLYLAFILAALYVAAVCAAGIPALRHDWWWPITRYGFIDLFWNSTSGWGENGIGSPYAYPGPYILGTVLSGFGLVLGPLPALAVYTFGIGLVCALGARSLGVALHSTPAQILSLEIFALCNPWVYSETVAGHSYMILAYGACLWIAAQLFQTRVRPVRTALLVLLTLAQLQFFLIAIAALAVHAFVRRAILPLLTSAIAGLPIWIGLLLDRGNLLSTPYTLAWQSSQSVEPLQAFVLQGYFTHYGDHFGPLQVVALWFFVACAATALFVRGSRKIAVGTLLLTATFLVYAMGTRSPLGGAYAWVVRCLPESGVFRELYDLVAFVAVGYTVLLALSVRNRILHAAQIVAAAILAVAWIMWPPALFWVDSRAIPVVSFDAPPNTRFALLPAFQPLQFHGRGSGADRDAYRRPGNVTPVNQYLAQYPVNVALAAFSRSGDSEDLRSLSVSTIIQRPWLSIDRNSISLQMNFDDTLSQPRGYRVQHLSNLPEVTLGDLPLVGSLTNRLGAGNVLFSDAGIAPIVPVAASNLFVNEAKGWVDVRFDFISHPELAQAIGGIVTTNPRALFSLPRARMTLINVSGILRDQNDRIVISSTQGYRWVRFNAGVTAVRCTGRCVIAAQTPLAAVPPLNPPPRRYRAVMFDSLTPWLARLSVPLHPRALLRYNVEFDPGWTAIWNRASLKHQRIDGTVNGWIVPATSAAQIIYLVHYPSLLQTIGECIGALWILGLVLYAVSSFLRARSAARTSS